jgi:hypothetical protein
MGSFIFIFMVCIYGVVFCGILYTTIRGVVCIDYEICGVRDLTFGISLGWMRAFCTMVAVGFVTGDWGFS